MNKNFHRIIFNAARGMRMVVQETARSVGRSTCTRASTSSSRSTAAGVLVFIASLTAISAAAQIASDRGAPLNQRPTVLIAPNGVPLVNIRVPSAAGVSRNTYRQFDVNGNGAILNNSRTNVQTQLGGYVQGNPWLARGSARVIVNEVNSSNPSYLRGFVEVAGPRAEVIISNPSGIFVNGSGLINANRATLTTGIPQFGPSGDLESYIVRSGTVGILGAGLDASTTDSLSILARAFELSGAMHATDLKVVAGANQISTDLTGITPIAGTGNAPAYAIDVAQLGGMYANHIALIVNESGVGARNAGTIQTSTGSYVLAGAGKLTLSMEGLLENSGLIQTSSDATIRAANLANSGTVQSAASLAIATQGDLANHIAGAGGTLEAQRVDLGSAAGDIDNRAGIIRQTGTAALTVTGPSLSNTNAGFIGAEPFTLSGSSGSGSTSSGSTGTTGATSGTTTGGSGSTSTGGSATTPALVSPGSLTAASSILNDSGKIYAGGDVALQTPNIDNGGGTISVANLAVSGPSFSNAGGTLNVKNTFAATVGTLNNAGGSLHASTIGIATTGNLNNQGGTLVGDGAVNLDVAGSLNNTLGSVQSSSGATQLAIANQLLNDKGSIGAGTDLSIQAGSLANTGTMRAERNTTVSAGRLTSSANGMLGAGIKADGTLGSTGDLTITTAGSLQAAGTVLAAGNIVARGAGTDLSGSNTSGANIALTATAGDVTTSHAKVTTPGTLSITANPLPGQSLVNDAGVLNAGQLDLHASNIQNANAGQIVQTGTGSTAIAVSGRLDNTGGTIASNGQDLTLTAATLLNTGGTLQHAGTGTLDIGAAQTFSGAKGQLASNGALNAHGGDFDLDGGTTSAAQISVNTGTLSNKAGSIVQTGTGTTRIATVKDLVNDGGTIATNAVDVELAAGGTLSNADGHLQHAGTGSLRVDAASFAGAKGELVSNGALVAVAAGSFGQDGGTTTARQLTIDAGSLSNAAGVITQTGTGTTRIATTGTLDNTAGRIASNGTDVSLAAGGTLSNANGHLQQAGTGVLNLTAGSYAGAKGELVTNGALVAHVAGSFSQDGGTTTARQLTIDAGSLGNVGGTLTQTGTAATHIATAGNLANDGGTIATNGTDLSLTAGGTLSNAGGKLQHAGAGPLNLTAGAYSGASGELVTNGQLVARVAGAFDQDGGTTTAVQVTIDVGSLSNVAGTITQTGSDTTHIAAAGTLNNDRGIVATNATDVELSAATFRNAAGTVRHAGTGALNIAATTFSGANGNILGNGALNVRAGAFNQEGGNTSAKLIALDANDIDNVGGAIVQTGTGVTRIAATGTLSNDGGTIASNGADLNITAGGTLSNANGHLQHAGTGALNLAAGSYSGASGEITTNNALVANVAGAFAQDGGSTSARQLTIDAGSLSNRGGEIVQTGTATATVAVAGGLDNSANGRIASNGNLTVTAASLINRGGSVRAAGTASLDLSTTGLLDSSNGGVIGAGANAVLRAGSLANDTGSVTAGGNLTATVTDAASNVDGTLAANGSTTVSAATLDNTRGSVAAVTGDLSVTTTGATTNTQGTLQAAGRTVLTNTGLANMQGKVTGNALSVNTNGGALDNAIGTLAGTTTVDLQTGVLNNDKGLIQSGGTLAVNAGSVDNAAGFIGAAGAITASTGRFTNAAGGVVLGKADVAITTDGATYDNRGGKTLALGNLTIDVGNGTVQNSGALIRSAGTTTVSAGTVNNMATLGTDQGIEGRNVAIAASNLNNDGGAIRADTNATITSAGTVSNVTGLMSAGDTLAILDPNRATPSAKRLAVTNTGGTLTAGKSLQLDAATFSADGTLASGQDLSIALTQDLVNNATVTANRNLTYATTGTLTNNGKLLAGNVLTVSGSDVENTATGEMRGDTTIVKASGTLTNRGLIDGRDTQVDASALVNAPTGRIYGDHLSISAGNVLNDADPTSAGTIAARNRLDIGAGSVINRDGALVFSGGDLFIGGALDASRQATGSASVVENKAATIEALNNVGIKANTLNNLNGGVTWRMDQTAAQVVEFAPPGSTVRFKASDVLIARLSGSSWTAVPGFTPDTNDNNPSTRLLIPSPSYPLAKFATYYATSPARSLDSSSEDCSSGAGQCTTTPIAGAWYAATDPIWRTFGVAAPARDLPADSALRLDRNAVVGQIGVYAPDQNGNSQLVQGFAHPVTQAEYDEAQTFYAAHASLDVATQKFVNIVYAGTDSSNPNSVAANASTPNGFYRDYSIWMYTATTDSPVLSTSAPAKIVSGGDMTLTVGSGAGSTNDMSQILAGRTLTVTGGAIANKPVEVLATTAVSGTALTTEVINHTFSSSKRRYDPAVFDLVIPPKTVTLAAARQEGNQNATSGKAPGTAAFSPTGATTSAAGAVDPGNRVNPILEVPSAVGGTPGVTGNSASVANTGNGSGVTGGSVGAAQSGGANAASGSKVGTSTGTAVGTASGNAAQTGNSDSGTAAKGTTQTSTGQPLVVRTAAPDITLPKASLFKTLPESGSHYLIETDPAFANYRNWLSSDYLLNALSYDPATVTKRLGDGFYEQRLIREQVAQLTGYRYLEGSTSDQDQYTALMNAGATFAKAYQLTPGIGLSAAQMAQLTSDIVWLVEQTVTLADGSTQQVLVPQVYVRVKPGDIDGSGALLSADALIIKNQPGQGDLVNSGTIAGRTMVAITADNVQNLNGRITGGSVGIEARKDLNSIGGTIDAQNAVSLKAGHDITIASTTQTVVGAKSSATALDRVAGVYVTNPGGTLVASAGHDVNVIGAILSNAGAGGVTSIKAGNDINLGTLKTGSSQDTTWNAKNYSRSTQSQDVGSAIVAEGAVGLAAGHDLNIKAGAVGAGGALTATAGNDINVTAGEANSSSSTASFRKKKNIFSSSSSTRRDDVATTEVLSSQLSGASVAMAAGNDLTLQSAQVNATGAVSLTAGRDLTLSAASASTTESHLKQDTRSATALGKITGVALGADTVGAKLVSSNAALADGAVTRTTAVGTTISAGSLQTLSGRDTKLQGATVVADNDITMIAGHNLTIESAQNTTSGNSFDKTSKSGMIGSATNPAFGNVKQDQSGQGNGVSQSASQVASLKGNVTLVAGNTYTQTASSVLAAGQAGPLVGGDVTILAKKVVIDEAFNTSNSATQTHSASTVLGGSASVGGISTDSLRSAANIVKAIGDTGDGRMQALGAVNLAMQGQQAYDTATALASGGTGYKVSVNVSRDKSENQSTTQVSEAVGSSIVGANNVTIVATGGGKESNILASGATITAGNTVNLVADNAIRLAASKNTWAQQGTNSSSGASVGVGFAGGSQNGFTIELGVSQGKGKQDGSDVSYNNTHVSGGKAVNVKSGGDLTLKGAVIDGKRVTADVGGKLIVESLQDTSTQISKQNNSGLNASLCIPPICYGVSTVGGGVAKSKADGDYASVTEQSGIKAGDGGFDVNVKGRTDLRGGVISSTQAAIDEKKNTFTTTSLTTSDIENHSTYKASGYSVSGSVSGALGDQSTATTAADKKAAENAAANSRPTGSAGVGSASGTQTSTTKAGISGIAGDALVRTGDDSQHGRAGEELGHHQTDQGRSGAGADHAGVWAAGFV